MDCEPNAFAEANRSLLTAKDCVNRYFKYYPKDFLKDAMLLKR